MWTRMELLGPSLGELKLLALKAKTNIPTSFAHPFFIAETKSDNAREILIRGSISRASSTKTFRQLPVYLVGVDLDNGELARYVASTCDSNDTWGLKKHNLEKIAWRSGRWHFSDQRGLLGKRVLQPFPYCGAGCLLSYGTPLCWFDGIDQK